MLAAKSAQFLQAFARIGLIPDAGGTFVLPRLVGDARARALMMLADPIGAEEAAAWGMIYRAVDDQDLMGEARTIAERLAAGPTHTLGLIKRALAASPGASLDAQLDLERDLQREAGTRDEYVEGVRAFLEKRPANFRRRGGKCLTRPKTGARRRRSGSIAIHKIARRDAALSVRAGVRRWLGFGRLRRIGQSRSEQDRALAAATGQPSDRYSPCA